MNSQQPIAEKVLNKIRNLTWDSELSLEQGVAIAVAIEFATASPEFKSLYGTFMTDQLKTFTTETGE